MPCPPLIKDDLINRYDKPGPHYTSYPPVTEFHDRISESDYRDWARLSNEEPIPKRLSLYFHIPFCSSICHYCARNKIMTGNRDHVESYLRDMEQEIEIQSSLFDLDREVRQLHWGGGTPGFLSHQQSQQLMEKIARHFKLSHDGASDNSIEIDPRIMAKDGITHLRKLGFNHISIAVQDFDAESQRAANLVQSLKTTSTIINDARRFGFRSINVDLVHGLPRQAPESFARTLATVINLAPDRITIYDYAHLPHRLPAEWSSKADSLPDTKRELAILQRAIDKLSDAGYEYIGLNQFARPEGELAVAQREGSLQRNFHGYSAHGQCDSIGFGIAAISNVGDNFSQNTTDLDAYHDILLNQELPVARGFHSEQDDLLRREIIHDLACHFRLDLRRVAKRWDIDFAQYFENELRRLGDMEEDGLVELGDGEIVISETGRLLERNICMIFDSYQQN
jgi:oxygen-independent coproporphyrinogen-3 oxidase